jgi:hypothetical protein
MYNGPLPYSIYEGRALERKLAEALARIDDLELAVVQLAEQDGEVSFTPRKGHDDDDRP